MNLDTLFKEKAFKNIDPKTISSLKNLSEKIKGKDFNETLDLIVEFSENMPKGINVSEEEKIIMIDTILKSLNEEERNKFKSILEMLNQS